MTDHDAPYAHRGLVGLVMRRFAHLQSADYHDLRQESWLTLMRCWELYDPAVAGFATYAIQSMQKGAGRYFQKTARFRRPSYIRKGRRTSRRLFLFSELGHDFTRGRNRLFAVAPDRTREPVVLADVTAVLFRFLPSRAGMVVRMRYGFETGVPLTLDEVARRLGVTRERVRQIERRAILTLRGEVAERPRLAAAIKDLAT